MSKGIEFELVLPDRQRVAGVRFGSRSPGADRVLLMHGWLDNSATWFPLLDLLLKQLPNSDFVCFDFTGHGRSSRPHSDAGYIHTFRAMEAAAVADALGWDTFYVMVRVCLELRVAGECFLVACG